MGTSRNYREKSWFNIHGNTSRPCTSRKTSSSSAKEGFIDLYVSFRLHPSSNSHSDVFWQRTQIFPNAFLSRPSSPCMEWNTSKIPALPPSQANVSCVPSFRCPHAEASGQKPKHLFLLSTSTTHDTSPPNSISLIAVGLFFPRSHIAITHFVIFSFSHTVHLHHSCPRLLAFRLCPALTHPWLQLREIMSRSTSRAHPASNGNSSHSPPSFPTVFLLLSVVDPDLQHHT